MLFIIKIEAYLVNYWPLSGLKDEIGNSSLYNGLNFGHVNNRYEMLNQATEFKNGCLQIPPGVYVENDFSVTAWVNLTGKKTYIVLVSFSNEEGRDSVWIGFKNMMFYIEISNASNEIIPMSSVNPVSMNNWTHVAFVLKNTTGYMYLNGIENYNSPLPAPIKIDRKLNFIGQDYYNSSLYLAEAIYDNLKVYKGAMTAEEINKEYKTDCKYIKKFLFNIQFFNFY